MSRRWFTLEQIARAKRLREGGYTLREVAERMGCDKGRIWKLEQRGWRQHVRGDRPRPMDLSLYASDETMEQLRARYRVGAIQLHRWLDEAGIERPCMRHQATLRPMPADFAQEAAGLTHKQAQRRWNATGDTIVRWKEQAGLPMPRRTLNKRRAARVTALTKTGWAERYVAARRPTPITTGAHP